jgi:P27 family predicted phage terminase small subunit
MTVAEPKPPADLDAESKRVWREAQRELDELGVWTAATVPLLALYCRALQTGRQARARITRRLKSQGEQGAFFSKGSMGQLVAHPDVGIARQAEADALGYGRELLLSPAARRRSRLDDSDDALLTALYGRP